jgi:hypothetical protein
MVITEWHLQATITYNHIDIDSDLLCDLRNWSLIYVDTVIDVTWLIDATSRTFPEEYVDTDFRILRLLY